MAGYQAPENNVELAAGGGGGKQSLSLMWVGGKAWNWDGTSSCIVSLWSGII